MQIRLAQLQGSVLGAGLREHGASCAVGTLRSGALQPWEPPLSRMNRAKTGRGEQELVRRGGTGGESPVGMPERGAPACAT